MSDIAFLSGKRTPFGTFLGALSKFSANDLGVLAGKAAIEQAGVNAEDIDHVIFGNVLQHQEMPSIVPETLVFVLVRLTVRLQ